MEMKNKMWGAVKFFVHHVNPNEPARSFAIFQEKIIYKTIVCLCVYVCVCIGIYHTEYEKKIQVETSESSCKVNIKVKICARVIHR